MVPESEARPPEGATSAHGRRHLRLAASLSARLSGADLPMASLLDEAAEFLAHEVGDSAVIALVDPTGRNLVPTAFRHRDPIAEEALRGVLTGQPTPVGAGLAGGVASTGIAVRLADLPDDWVRGQINPMYHRFLDRFGFRSVLIVAMISDGRILGTVGMIRDAPYDQVDEDLLVDLAGRIAAGLDRARLLAELRATAADIATEREQLAREHQRLRRIADHLPALIGYFDADLRNEFANRAYTEMLGQHPETMLGHHISEILPPETYARNKPFMDAALAGRAQRFDRDIIDPEGKVRHTEISYVPDIVDDRVVGLFVMVTDVTERREQELASHAAEASARASEQRYRLLADNMFDVVMVSNDDQIIWVSPSLHRQLGWLPEEWLGHQLAEFQVPPGPGEPLGEVTRNFADGSTIRRLRLRDATGAARFVETHSRTLGDQPQGSGDLITNFRTVDEEVRLEFQMLRRARYDDLTGLLKRSEVLDQLSRIPASEHKVAGARTGLLFCDVDDFKDANDRLGHGVGDQLLMQAAARIRSCVRTSDTLARMGGDEFLVVLRELHDLSELTALAEKIRLIVGLPMFIEGASIRCTLSVGAILIGEDEDPTAALRRADHAMYLAKRAGRDRVITISAND